MTTETIRAAVQAQCASATRLLADLISFPSTSGREHDAMVYLDRAFRETGLAVDRVAMSNALRNDPDYSNPIEGIEYDGRFNLRAVLAGSGGGRSIILNSHTDVVPPSVGQTDPWTPTVSDGVMYGRGACDAKGQVATIYLVMKTLRALNIQLRGDVIAHVVNEEENGGNGTLAMVRTGERADACIVLEPSERRIFTAIRGAVWFRLVFSGRAGHSGQAAATRSALLMARDAIGILEAYHSRLLKRSRGQPLFDVHPNPMPITFGRFESGNWPAAAPSKALIEGVLGLLPNVTKEEVCRGMEAALRAADDEYLARNFELSFLYRHDSSVIEPEHPLAQGMMAAAAKMGATPEIAAMTASCDAWFYRNILDIPTLVYGPGTLKVAHSKDEQIPLAEIAAAAETLVQFVIEHSI